MTIGHSFTLKGNPGTEYAAVPVSSFFPSCWTVTALEQSVFLFTLNKHPEDPPGAAIPWAAGSGVGAAIPWTPAAGSAPRQEPGGRGGFRHEVGARPKGARKEEARGRREAGRRPRGRPEGARKGVRVTGDQREAGGRPRGRPEGASKEAGERRGGVGVGEWEAGRSQEEPWGAGGGKAGRSQEEALWGGGGARKEAGRWVAEENVGETGGAS